MLGDGRQPPCFATSVYSPCARAENIARGRELLNIVETFARNHAAHSAGDTGPHDRVRQLMMTVHTTRRKVAPPSCWLPTCQSCTQLVDRSPPSSTDLHRCLPTFMGNPLAPTVCLFSIGRSYPGSSTSNQRPPWRVRRANPHGASRTVPIPRFCPLVICVRRLSVYVAPSSASANVHTCRREHVR